MKNRKRFLKHLIICLALILTNVVSIYAEDTVGSISLAGEWKFRLDPNAVGIKSKWYNQNLADKIFLPGSTDEQGYGKKNTGPIEFDPGKGNYNRLIREYEYVGPAWYQRQIEIPPLWAGKRITVFLERCHWETSLWLDGQFIGTQNSLSVPHIYDISQSANPGKHTLTICVDNTLKINICHHIAKWRWTHAVTDETQTNWNGIVGKIELNATDLLFVKSLKIYPEVYRQRVKVLTTVENTTDKDANAVLLFEINENFDLNKNITQLNKKTVIPPGTSDITTFISFPAEPNLWDEFNPFLYKLRISLTGTVDGSDFYDKKADTFGIRLLGVKGHKFTLNGRNIYLRGNVDCCIFPLTGYPPMNIDGWLKVIRTIKSYGMNHIRFHSWCPPEAAFMAADNEGMILQIEAPLWDGDGQIALLPKRAKFIQKEVRRIIDIYGNHPSFCLLSMGNELGTGNEQYLKELVAYCQKEDPRHLYTCTTAPYTEDRNDDYYVAGGTPKGDAYGFYRQDGSMPTTDFDYRQVVENVNRPFVVHEMGHPEMFPDIREISKYTGNLKPYPFIEYRKSLEEHGLLSQAENFRRSTGAFTVLLYKRLIELNLLTPNMAGFQLLGLQDFPGQGVALVGILDAFLDSKQLIAPAHWRQFCNSTVPLLRMKKSEWCNNETLDGQIEVYHYGRADLQNVNVVWKVSKVDGTQLKTGKFGPINIATGELSRIGRLHFPLKDINKAQKLLITVSIDGTVFKNSWPIWVYPVSTDMSIPKGITVTAVWNDEVKSILNKGGKVLFLPPKSTLSNAISSHFYPVYWNYLLFSVQPRTMGIICNPQHPALAEFPTEFHTNWQWYDLLQGYSHFPTKLFPNWGPYDLYQGYSDAIILNDAPKNLKPIVSFIDDVDYNYRLAAIFELKVGAGKLLVSSLDIQNNLDERPAAKQLRKSLLQYMLSKKFNPGVNMQPEQLDKLFCTSFNLDFVGVPNDVNNAVLNILAGAGETTAANWQPDADKVVKKQSGFDYSVEANVGKIWFKQFWTGKNVVIKVHCPEDFTGTFYVHYEDIDRQGRVADISFNGKDIGPLSRYDGNGIWLKFPVNNKRPVTDKLVLDTRSTAGSDVVITQIILMPDNPKK